MLPIPISFTEEANELCYAFLPTAKALASSIANYSQDCRT